MDKVDTRERLIAAAQQLFYRQGYQGTTLVEVAQQADVPPGNVYYHFKTKDSLLEAVIVGYQQHVEHDCVRLDGLPDPRDRLRAYFAVDDATSRTLAASGCPYGTLCQELEKIDSPLADGARRILQTQIDWVAHQLLALGKGDTARDQATALVALQQGLYLLSNTLHSPELLTHQLETLDLWLAEV
jgi:AcrR family transcriptional regulator